MKRFEATVIHKLNVKLNNNSFYIKRDDLLPLSFGGNKVRKAVLFFEEIQVKGNDCIVTYGTSSSNHCRIIANMAVKKGLPCYIIAPQEASNPTTNSILVDIFKAKIVRCPVASVSDTIEKTLEDLKVKGYHPYFIQGGGHGNIGTQAYVDCYKEIIDYEKSNKVYFDYIFHATGTGTTQAGLICGKKIHNGTGEIIGISNARKNPYGGQVVLNSVNDYLKNIGKDGINSELVNFIDDYVLNGYGTYNKEILQTIREVLTMDGVPLDTTYTGKAFWGMKEYIMKNQIINKNILFIHTGGTPLFFDDLGELIYE